MNSPGRLWFWLTLLGTPLPALADETPAGAGCVDDFGHERCVLLENEQPPSPPSPFSSRHR